MTTAVLKKTTEKQIGSYIKGKFMVCLVKQTNDLVTLVCGSFFIIKD